MKFNEYQRLAHCTEAPVNEAMLQRFDPPINIRLLHGAMGLCTEAGELQDQLKRHLFYGKPLDGVNVAEEIGDALWYLALIANALNIDLEEIAERNIAKLKARYPAKFTEHDALNRDLDNERKILEELPSEKKETLTGLFRDRPDTPEGKYLVKRRDGTVVEWPSFVLGARDPHAEVALLAYANSVELKGGNPGWVASLRNLANVYRDYRKTHGEGDPGKGPHRKDDPATIAEMQKGQSA